jgi:archaellum component FlaC
MCLNLLPIFFLLAETIASQVSQNAGFRVPRVRHQTDNNSWESRRFCNTDQLEYRLTKLEVQVAEKSEGVLSELRESNRRLQALELQSAEVQSAIETFKNELGRFMENHNNQQRYATSDGPSNKLELRVDNLAKGVQLVVANVRRINSDIGAVKSNLSAVARNTNTLLLKHGDLVTKPFLTDSLTDVKHHHVYQQPLKTANSFQCDKDIPRNCKEVLEKGSNTSGIYLIQPKLAPRPFMVLCEMESKGGGWTYVLNRYEGVQDFYLNWRNYKLGFGNLGGEFWLGLEYLHQLTGK